MTLALGAFLNQIFNRLYLHSCSFWIVIAKYYTRYLVTRSFRVYLIFIDGLSPISRLQIFKSYFALTNPLMSFAKPFRCWGGTPSRRIDGFLYLAREKDFFKMFRSIFLYYKIGMLREGIEDALTFASRCMLFYGVQIRWFVMEHSSMFRRFLSVSNWFFTLVVNLRLFWYHWLHSVNHWYVC